MSPSVTHSGAEAHHAHHAQALARLTAAEAEADGTRVGRLLVQVAKRAKIEHRESEGGGSVKMGLLLAKLKAARKRNSTRVGMLARVHKRAKIEFDAAAAMAAERKKKKRKRKKKKAKAKAKMAEWPRRRRQRRRQQRRRRRRPGRQRWQQRRRQSWRRRRRMRHQRRKRRKRRKRRRRQV